MFAESVHVDTFAFPGGGPLELARLTPDLWITRGDAGATARARTPDAERETPGEPKSGCSPRYSTSPAQLMYPPSSTRFWTGPNVAPTLLARN